MSEHIKTADELIGEYINSPTISLKKDKLNKEDNVIYTSFLETPEYILEQIKVADDAEHAELYPNGNETVFLKYSRSTGEIEYINQYIYKEKTYKPIVDEIFLKGGVSLPTGIKEYKNTKEIIGNISNYLMKQAELPLFYQKFLPNLVLFYWLYEKFPFIPYVHFVGGTGTGKSTAMEAIGSICYKSIETTGSLTVASMFRVATIWKGTLLIDEFDKMGDNSKEITLFLKAGVSNKLIIRTEGETKKELKAYVVKAPKIFTSENPINDAGLQSRTLVVKMDKNTREIPLYKMPEDYEEAEEIRNQLLLWRLRNYDTVNLKSIRFGFPELKIFDRRVQQIITPAYYFSDEETKKDILLFAKEQENETLRSRREAVDGLVFELLIDSWSKSTEIDLKTLTSKFNEDNKNRGYKSEVTERKIGNVIRKILGFETERRGHDRNYWIIKDNEQIERKCSYYGINFPLGISSAHSASSATSDIQNNNISEEIVSIFDTEESLPFKN